jgi:hypothetical protein
MLGKRFPGIEGYPPKYFVLHFAMRGPVLTPGSDESAQRDGSRQQITGSGLGPSFMRSRRPSSISVSYGVRFQASDANPAHHGDPGEDVRLNSGLWELALARAA